VPGELLVLAAQAAQTVVAAASTDVWGSAKSGLARLLGRGDEKRAALAEGRLEEARVQLATASGPEADQARARVEAAWQTRLVDLLEEYPDAAADLRALMEQLQAALPAATVASSAAGHSVAAGGDVRITASDGGFAAGAVHGNVTLNPTRPGSASQ
jgi:hypothetical protein